MNRHHVQLVVGSVLASTGLCVGVAQIAHAAPGAPTLEEPGPKTIVEITGDKANGFTIEHYDGTFLFPPTDSEANAECTEYHARVKEVRCHAQVNTWYRDLGQTQAALAYAYGQAG